METAPKKQMQLIVGRTMVVVVLPTCLSQCRGCALVPDVGYAYGRWPRRAMCEKLFRISCSMGEPFVGLWLRSCRHSFSEPYGAFHEPLDRSRDGRLDMERNRVFVAPVSAYPSVFGVD